jgi:hypothetical protein
MLHKSIFDLIDCIIQCNGINNKSKLIQLVTERFNLTKDRCVYYSEHYSIRFSYSSGKSFSNTVISLSNLQKFDNKPFIVCLVTAKENILYLVNSTFVNKVSHSSQTLTVNNIKGSINGSDIIKVFNDIPNTYTNFEKLFNIHKAVGFDTNLIRLVENTNNISPCGNKFKIIDDNLIYLINSPIRTLDFINSSEYSEVKLELDEKVNQFKNEILIASFIENVNLRGRIIEYLIAGEDNSLRSILIEALHSNISLPSFKTKNNLGDYNKVFEQYKVSTDIKTKIMVLQSNPKAYNIDKVLEFLCMPQSVFLFYFIGIDPNVIVNTILVSLFQKELLQSTIVLKHWAGRNSRGVTQFDGEIIRKLLYTPNNDINFNQSKQFLDYLISL